MHLGPDNPPSGPAIRRPLEATRHLVHRDDWLCSDHEGVDRYRGL
jgi:hypothetical protein